MTGQPFFHQTDRGLHKDKAIHSHHLLEIPTPICSLFFIVNDSTERSKPIWPQMHLSETVT